jgi:hypothetical protein
MPSINQNENGGATNTDDDYATLSTVDSDTLGNIIFGIDQYNLGLAQLFVAQVNAATRLMGAGFTLLDIFQRIAQQRPGGVLGEFDSLAIALLHCYSTSSPI